MLDREPILASLQAHEAEIRASTMSRSVGTNNRLICLLVLVVVVAICHRAIAVDIDPAIPCKKSEDCLAYSSVLKNATCKNAYCFCETSTESKNCSSQSVPQNSSRNTASPIIRGCKVDQNCILKNSFCNTTISQCECQKDYVLSTDRKECLKKADAIDFPCVETKQCLAFLQNTTCRQNGQCSCIDGYHYSGTACYKTIELGEPCTQSEECTHVDGATCIEGNVCNCPAETVISNDKKRCLQVAAEILTYCVEDQQCIITFPKSVCIDNKCQCQAQYHFEPTINQCVVDKGLNDDCGNAYECYQAGDNATTKAMQCTGNICVCAEGFNIEDDKCVSSEGTQLLGTLSAFLLAAFVHVAFLRQI